jgi:hypothetical protein
VPESGPSAHRAETLEIEPGYRIAAAGHEAAEDERLSPLEQLYDPLSLWLMRELLHACGVGGSATPVFDE